MSGSRLSRRGASADAGRPRLGRPVPLSRLLPAVVGLASLAVSQPLLDLVAHQPQFLVAHGLSPLEVVVAAVAVVLVPVAVLGVTAWGGRLGRWPAGVAVATPMALILLHAATRAGLEGGAALLVAGSGSALVSAIYVGRPRWQELGRYLAFVPAVVLAYFFVVLPSAVLAGEESEPGAAVDPARPVPVVVVVLDELPVASLIDPEGQLLEERFPSFARLASDGVWYRNAITVETRTTESIPAVLTGRRVEDDQVPNAANHPHTLMTMLARSHDVGVVEPVTELCPRRLCTPDPGQRSGGRWLALASDLAVVYGHLVVPRPWVDRLPAIDQEWTGFIEQSDEESWDLVEAVGEAVEGDRRADVDRFLTTLEGDHDAPLLRVAHLILPHRPWEFLADGSRHGQQGPDGYGGRGWGSDGFFVAEGWRRHLLQVEYVDAVIGSVIARLEETGSYDSSLLIVVADHGVHFATDVEDMRVTNRRSLGSILPVPLFVKYPVGLAAAPPPGTVDDRRVETVDVVPTVLDVMGAAPPPGLDGLSLLSDFERSGSVLELRGEPFPVGADGREKLAVAVEKEAWFPGGDVWSLVPDPSLRSLLGSSLDPVDEPGTQLQVAGTDSRLPLIEGWVASDEQVDATLVALTDGDDRVIAVSKSFGWEGGRGRFSFLVDPGAGHQPPFTPYLLTEERTLTE